MRFNIITPTYNRSDKLLDAVKSVIGQTYSDWRMFIINDSPLDKSYDQIETTLKKDERIIYIKNAKNMGVNFSRNIALEIIQTKSTSDDWVVFLDDDDSLSKDALEVFVKINKDHPHEKWILTNRIIPDVTTLTKIPETNKHYSYIFGFLLTKRLSGDATHCIAMEKINNIRFPKQVKQAEEWLFYYELSLNIKRFFYYNHNSTISSGYSAGGLNFRKRTKKERVATLYALVRESSTRGIIWHPTILIYFLARIISLAIK